MVVSVVLPVCRSKRPQGVQPASASFSAAEEKTRLSDGSGHSASFPRPKSARKAAVNRSFDETADRTASLAAYRSITPTCEITNSVAAKSYAQGPELTSPRNQPGRKTSFKTSGTVDHLNNSKVNGHYSRVPNGFVTPKRPASARERGSTTPLTNHSQSQQRCRSRERTMSEGGESSQNCRSRSVGAVELGRQLQNRRVPFGTPNSKNGPEVLLVSRDSSGQHRFAPVTNLGADGKSRNGFSRTEDEFKRPMTPRVQISPDRILPDKPKILRSGSTESSDSGGSSGASNGNGSTNGAIPKTSAKSPGFGVPRTTRSLSLSSVPDDDDDLEPPPENKALNEKMERLFQEYLKLELGVNGEDSKYTFAPVSRSRKASGSSEGSESVSSYNSYSTKSASSFQKSCSSSREDILGSTSTSGRGSPGLGNTSPKKAPLGRNSTNSKHSTSAARPGVNASGTPRSARKALDLNANRPSTPVGGRTSNRPSSAASNRSNTPSHNRKITSNSETKAKPRSTDFDGGKLWTETLSQKNLPNGDQPGERGRSPVRTATHVKERTRTGAYQVRERGRTSTRNDQFRESGRTPTRVSSARERGRTPTRAGRTETDIRGRARTPTRNNSQERCTAKTTPTGSHERGRTPTRVDRTEVQERARPWARTRSRSRDILNDTEGTSSRTAAASGVTPKAQRKLPPTPVQQNGCAKPATPARPASARAVPYHQRNGSRENLLEHSRSRAQQPAGKPSTPVRPASARANPYQRRRGSREDLLDGGGSGERGRSRAVTHASKRRSSSTTALERAPLTVREPRTPEHSLSRQLDLDLSFPESRLTPKPRRDERPGLTKIPMPNDQIFAKPAALKRFDSGVDIATISPTESSIHSDELWQQDIMCSKLANGGAAYSQCVNENSSYKTPNLNETHNYFDDDSEYF